MPISLKQDGALRHCPRDVSVKRNLQLRFDDLYMSSVWFLHVCLSLHTLFVIK